MTDKQQTVRDAWTAGQLITQRCETALDLAVLAVAAATVVAVALFVIAFTATRSPR